MKLFYASISVFFLATIGVIMFLVNRYGVNLYDIYSEKLRMPLFTGFLTLGGFLLTLKTFVLIKLKEGLYDHEKYQELHAERKELNSEITYYGPLSRLGNFLIFSVLLALLTSFYQFTFGFIKCNIVAAIGLALAVTTAVLVLISWWNIRNNLNSWFKLLEREKK